MPSITLKVTPQQLKQTADEVTGLVQSLQTDFDSLQTTVSRTAYYWEGQAADGYRKSCASPQDDTDQMLERLREFPPMLLQMAGIYEDTEKANQALAAALPIDYID